MEKKKKENKECSDSIAQRNEVPKVSLNNELEKEKQFLKKRVRK